MTVNYLNSVNKRANLSLFLSLSVFYSLSSSLSLSVFYSLSFSLSFSLCLSLPLFLFLSLFLSLSLSAYLSLIIPFSHAHARTLHLLCRCLNHSLRYFSFIFIWKGGISKLSSSIFVCMYLTFYLYVYLSFCFSISVSI